MSMCFKIKFYEDYFENSIERLSFLCSLGNIKFVWINPYYLLQSHHHQHKLQHQKNFLLYLWWNWLSHLVINSALFNSSFSFIFFDALLDWFFCILLCILYVFVCLLVTYFDIDFLDITSFFCVCLLQTYFNINFFNILFFLSSSDIFWHWFSLYFYSCIL